MAHRTSSAWKHSPDSIIEAALVAKLRLKYVALDGAADAFAVTYR
jgi:hypothetical protein